MKAWLYDLLDRLAWWWLRLDGAVASADTVLYVRGNPYAASISTLSEPISLEPRAPLTPPQSPTETCPRCHNHMDAWKTYADGKRECLSCAHAPKRHR